MDWNEFLNQYFTMADIVGYVASIFVALSFCMKTILPLRVLAICSNIAFVSYGFLNGLYPVLILHIFLFPVNILRLIQMKILIDKIATACKGDLSMDFLIPYMKQVNYKTGDIIFNKGDEANFIFFLQKGEFELKEFQKTINTGTMIGELGIFSPYKQRTATAVCKTDVEAFIIGESKIIQLYYQNPAFGFYLIQLISRRFVENIKTEKTGG